MVLGNGANKKNIITKQMKIDDTTGQIFEVNMHFDN